MTEQPRNWDKELADIDKVIARQPAPASAPRPGQGSRLLQPQRRFVALTWFWTGLAIVLAVALPLWPNDKSCGLRLVFYLGAAGIALLMGVLGALASWSHRRGLAFVLSLAGHPVGRRHGDPGDPAPGGLCQAGAPLDLSRGATGCGTCGDT